MKSENKLYKRIRGVRIRLAVITGSLFAGMGFGAVAVVILFYFFGSPSENELLVENSKLKSQYNILSRQLDQAFNVMKDIQQRDDNLYRVVFRSEPVNSEVRNSTFATTNRYESLMGMESSELVINTTHKLDMLKKNIYIQSKSLDELVNLYKHNAEKILYTPSIQPVSAKKLKYISSGFGPRIDPIYGNVRFHQGLDFSANAGTEVYASANGKVVKAGWQQGYGNVVWIDHGFGYTTVYAHLRKCRTSEGKSVTRGEIIGEVGSTGKSTSPHLHYEVHVNGKPVDPINYMFMDLSAEEYDKMVREANNNSLVLD